jgi:osmotically-inducible protein OsmY
VFAGLKWDARLQPNEIGVIVKDGVVTLTGWLDSYLKKWTGEDVAHRVTGVKAVANDIEVKLPSERTDPDIAAAAIRAIEWDAAVPSDKVQVTVSKDWVTLKDGCIAREGHFHAFGGNAMVLNGASVSTSRPRFLPPW